MTSTNSANFSSRQSISSFWIREWQQRLTYLRKIDKGEVSIPLISLTYVQYLVTISSDEAEGEDWHTWKTSSNASPKLIWISQTKDAQKMHRLFARCSVINCEFVVLLACLGTLCWPEKEFHLTACIPANQPHSRSYPFSIHKRIYILGFASYSISRQAISAIRIHDNSSSGKRFNFRYDLIIITPGTEFRLCSGFVRY